MIFGAKAVYMNIRWNNIAKKLNICFSFVSSEISIINFSVAEFQVPHGHEILILIHFFAVSDAHDDKGFVCDSTNEKDDSKSSISIGQDPITIGWIAKATANKMI